MIGAAPAAPLADQGSRPAATMRVMSALEEIVTAMSSNSQAGAVLRGAPGIGSAQPAVGRVGVRLQKARFR